MEYSCRAHLFQRVQQFELKADCLVQHGSREPVEIPFSGITEIVVFKERRFGSSRS
jgi:hypothetical protein